MATHMGGADDMLVKACVSYQWEKSPCGCVRRIIDVEVKISHQQYMNLLKLSRNPASSVSPFAGDSGGRYNMAILNFDDPVWASTSIPSIWV